MTPTNARLFYLIATYGKKPGENITLSPAVSGQIANLRIRFPRDSEQQDLFMGDYARKIRHLEDLPRLKSFLQKIVNFKGSALILDDISRIFIICETLERAHLFEELQPFSDRLISVRHNLKLCDFNDTQRQRLILNPQKSTNARKLKTSQVERADATEEARIASIVSRQSAATRRNMQIAELQLQMLADGKPSSSADVANEANESHLRTSTGLQWSGRSVRDAVRDAKREKI